MQKRITAVFIDPDIVIVDDRMTENWLSEITDSALNHLKITRSKSIEIAITNDQKMRELNLRHLGIDRTTDVLSFSNISRVDISLYSGEENDAAPGVIGEVVISSHQAKRQSDTKTL